MLENAIKKAKGNEEQKIGVSLKMTKSFKEKLQATADTNDISLNALIISILETAYEEKPKTLPEQVEELGRKILEYDECIEKGVDENLLGYNPFTAKKLAKRELYDLEQFADATIFDN